MRVRSAPDGARDPGDRGHVCWTYDKAEDFFIQARAWLAAGLAANHRVCLVGSGDVAELAEQLRPMDGIDDAFRRGAVQVVSLDELYPADTPVDPVAQVRTYAESTERALADGFQGFRVAADATDLVRGPAQLDAFARYEHLVDRYMAKHPYSAMCAYNRTELGDDVLAQLACLHPRTNAALPAFRLHAWTSIDSAVALDGELDIATGELWPLALDRVEPRPVAGQVVIDGRGLRFIDHRSLFVLADYAERRGVTAVLRTPLASAAKLVGILEVDGVRVEPVG